MGGAPRRIRLVFRLLGGLCLVVCATGRTAASHPTLVQVNFEGCVTCHEELVKGHTFSHSPVEDDCTVCHEVNKGDDGTEIKLSEPEPQLCLMCHDDKEAAANGDLASPHAATMDSCLNCHQVHGGEHEALLTEERREVCFTCHDSGDLESSHAERLPENSDCMSCHLPHGGPNEHMFTGSKIHSPFADGSCDGCHRKPFGERVRLRNRGEKVCTACHGDFDVPEGGVTHQAMFGKRSRAGCLNCHDPHMSNYTAMLKAEGPGLCGSCHEEIAGLLQTDNVHPPAEEDCLGCHSPHVAAESRLLDSAPQELCLMCHDADDAELSGKHLGADLAALDCISCHNPHGSEHGKLLAKNLHAPVLDGCDTCHEGAFNELMDGGESSLCQMCHDVPEEVQVPHAAMEMARCADCHNAHASPNELLVSGSGAEVCVECHDDKAPQAGETAHGAIELFGCQACHLPHGGNEASMLRVPGDDLCLGCHEVSQVRMANDGSGAVLLDRFPVEADLLRTMTTLELAQGNAFGHPTAGHLVRGTPTEKRLKRIETTHRGEIGCATCHDPHKGTGGHLFRWNAAGPAEACSHCHPGK